MPGHDDKANSFHYGWKGSENAGCFFRSYSEVGRGARSGAIRLFIVVPRPASVWTKGIRSIREAKKLSGAVADEERLRFNDELRHHSKLAVFFDLKGGL